MGWKISTIALGVLLVVAIFVGEWQISSNRHQSISGQAQLAALIVQDRLSVTRGNSALKQLVADGVGQVLGEQLSPIDTNITNLQNDVRCLEQDITDLENASPSYLICANPN